MRSIAGSRARNRIPRIFGLRVRIGRVKMLRVGAALAVCLFTSRPTLQAKVVTADHRAVVLDAPVHGKWLSMAWRKVAGLAPPPVSVASIATVAHAAADTQELLVGALEARDVTALAIRWPADQFICPRRSSRQDVAGRAACACARPVRPPLADLPVRPLSGAPAPSAPSGVVSRFPLVAPPCVS